MAEQSDDAPKRDTRKLSLYGLGFEEALGAALQVEPPAKPAGKRPAEKKSRPTPAKE